MKTFAFLASQLAIAGALGLAWVTVRGRFGYREERGGLTRLNAWGAALSRPVAAATREAQLADLLAALGQLRRCVAALRQAVDAAAAAPFPGSQAFLGKETTQAVAASARLRRLSLAYRVLASDEERLCRHLEECLQELVDAVWPGPTSTDAAEHFQRVDRATEALQSSLELDLWELGLDPQASASGAESARDP